MSLYIGLMSGTSMDGIDAALVDVETQQLIAGMTCPYSEKLRATLKTVSEGEPQSLKAISQLNTILGQAFGEAALALLKKAHIPASTVSAIGSHGQTVCHDAKAEIPYTMQLGCAHTIAELTGLTVVADFRTRDLVLGGQGAPFAPIYHQVLFGKEPLPLALVNIGGISNVTYLLEGNVVLGHDLGPGNCLMDSFIQETLRLPYDANGEWASTGRVLEPLLASFLDDPYFHRKAPKSIGKEYFSMGWLRQHLTLDYKPEDIQATLLALTARTIAHEIRHSPYDIKRVAICGGGVHNQALMQVLSLDLKGVDVFSTISLGVDPDYIEAMMFAWFASKAMNHHLLDLTSFTGSKRGGIYGVIYPCGAA